MTNVAGVRARGEEELLTGNSTRVARLSRVAHVFHVFHTAQLLFFFPMIEWMLSWLPSPMHGSVLFRQTDPYFQMCLDFMEGRFDLSGSAALG